MRWVNLFQWSFVIAYQLKVKLFCKFIKLFDNVFNICKYIFYSRSTMLLVLNIFKTFIPFYICSEFYNLIYTLCFCLRVLLFFHITNLHLKCKNNTSMSPPHPCLLKLLIFKSIVNKSLLRIIFKNHSENYIYKVQTLISTGCV